MRLIDKSSLGSATQTAETPLPNVAPSRSETAMLLLVAALLGFICLWTVITLRDPELHVVLKMTKADLAGCFVQNLLVWCVTAAVALWLGRRRRMGWMLFAITLCNLVALGHLADARCKHLFYQPVTLDTTVTSLRELGTLRSSLPVFFGGTFWILALASLVAMNGAIVLSGFNQVYRVHARWPHLGRRLIVILWIAALPLSATALSLKPQPYHLDDNFLSGPIINRLRTAPSTRTRYELASQCDQKARVLDLRTDSESSLRWRGIARGRNIVLIIGESWGYDETSLGDPDANATPFLQELARIGPIATAAYAQTSLSTKAMYGVLTGRYASPSIEIVESMHQRLPSLPRTLAEEGYRSFMISAQYLTWQNTWHQFKSMGFSEVVSARELFKKARRQGREPPGNSYGVDDRELLQNAVDGLPRDRPFLFMVYTMNTHEPYFMPGPSVPNETGYGRFRRALRYSDQVVRELVAQLKRRGQYDNSIFVVVGDHGENFANGEFDARGCKMTEKEHRTALVVAVPSLTSSQKELARPIEVKGARQIDIVPTILELLGITSRTPLQGVSLLTNRPVPPVYLNGYGACEVAGLVDGYTKYVYDLSTQRGVVLNLEKDAQGRFPVEMDSTQTRALARRLQACAQYNDKSLR